MVENVPGGLPPDRPGVVRVYSSDGRHFLEVNGFIVAIEGHRCSDIDLGGGDWTRDKLVQVVEARRPLPEGGPVVENPEDLPLERVLRIQEAIELGREYGVELTQEEAAEIAANSERTVEVARKMGEAAAKLEAEIAWSVIAGPPSGPSQAEVEAARRHCLKNYGGPPMGRESKSFLERASGWPLVLMVAVPWVAVIVALRACSG